jgi:hypothetical protein
MLMPWGRGRSVGLSPSADQPLLLAGLSADYPDLSTRVVCEALEHARSIAAGSGDFAAGPDGGVASLARARLDLARTRRIAAAQRIACPGAPESRTMSEAGNVAGQTPTCAGPLTRRPGRPTSPYNGATPPPRPTAKIEFDPGPDGATSPPPHP